jgi:O-antigen/teichoic acid export membrane protein
MNSIWIQYLPGFIRRRLEGRHVLQEAIGNTGWLFADKIVRMGLGLVIGVWVARYLGPAQYGLLNFSSSFVALFFAVSILGLDAIVVRDLVRYPGEINELLGTTFLLRLLAGGVMFVAACLTIFILRPQEPTTHILVMLSGGMLFFQAVDVIDLWFQSEVRSRYVVMAKNGAFLLAALVRGGLVLNRAPLIAFAVANLLEFALGAAGLVVFYQRNGQAITRWRVRAAKIRQLLTECFPLIMAGIVYMVYMRIDQVMLGQMVGDREVGIYAAAVRISEVWYFIPAAVVSSVFPNIVKARESDENEFYQRLQKLFNILAFMGYAVAVPATFCAGLVVTLLFGKEYSSAGPMLAVLIWAGVFTNLFVARNTYLLAMNWSKLLFVTTLVGAASNVVLNLILIPRYGGLGAALSSLISYWLATHGACYLIRPLNRVASMQTRALIYPRFW